MLSFLKRWLITRYRLGAARIVSGIHAIDRPAFWLAALVLGLLNASFARRWCCSLPLVVLSLGLLADHQRPAPLVRWPGPQRFHVDSFGAAFGFSHHQPDFADSQFADQKRLFPGGISHQQNPAAFVLRRGTMTGRSLMFDFAESGPPGLKALRQKAALEIGQRGSQFVRSRRLGK